MMNNGSRETYAIVGSSRKNLAVDRRILGILETLNTEYPWIEVTDLLLNEDSDEISHKVVHDLLMKESNLTGICFAGVGCEGGIHAVLDLNRNIKIVTFDLTEVTKKYLKAGIITATVCHESHITSAVKYSHSIPILLDIG